MKYVALLLFLNISVCNCFSQKYNWDNKEDGIALGLSTSFWFGARHVKKQTPPPSLMELSKLDQNSLWEFDKISFRTQSIAADRYSDYLLWGSATLPFISFVNQNNRDNAGSITGMAFQTVLITDGIISLLKGTVKRYRPYTYQKSRASHFHMGAGSKHSFASGHTSTTAAMSFFTAKVLTDLNPESNYKPLIWGLAATIPAVTGFLRIKAGKHFPTDVIMGFLIGGAVGLLVPHFHLN